MQFHGDDRLVEYIMLKCNVTRGVALIALNYNKGSVIHAQSALEDPTFVARCFREACEGGFK